MSLGTQGSSLSRKYYLYKKPAHSKTDGGLKNIFNLTNNASQYSELYESPQQSVKSRQYSEISLSLSSSPTKKFIEPSKSIVLPILTQTKYNPKINNHSSGYSMPIKQANQNKTNLKVPKYIADLQTIDGRNFKRMKAYNKKWEKMIKNRLQNSSNNYHKPQQQQDSYSPNPEQISLLKHSVRKSEIYEQMHDKQIPERQRKIQFQHLLRNQRTIQCSKMKQKGMRAKSIGPLRGIGGKVQPLFQEMFMVEEIYKFDKSGKRKKQTKIVD